MIAPRLPLKLMDDIEKDMEGREDLRKYRTMWSNLRALLRKQGNVTETACEHSSVSDNGMEHPYCLGCGTVLYMIGSYQPLNPIP